MPEESPVISDPNANAHTDTTSTVARRNSTSQQSDTSQTAADFIRNQEMLEADAREALPYSIDTCTNILGPLRQNVFACLTCNPAPSSSPPTDSWKPAGICYSCSVQCHGEHNLVEIFQKRNFTCDCGTKRIPSTTPCAIRTNNKTNTCGGVHSEEPDANNRYNQNFKNRFCGCECDYDPFQQKGTMFQCLGLGTVETGGCGEDWYHPGCLVGMGPEWFKKMKPAKAEKPNNGSSLESISEEKEVAKPTIPDEAVVNKAEEEKGEDEEDEDPPMPPGFPEEDDFESFICYKCVEAHPWIKAYVGAPGFLPPVFLNSHKVQTAETGTSTSTKKRKVEDEDEQTGQGPDIKRVKSEEAPSIPAPSIPAPIQQQSPDESNTAPTSTNPPETTTTITASKDVCKLSNLPTPPTQPFSLFIKEDFRSHLCHCSTCFPNLSPHPQLLEEEETYEPPLSDGGGDTSQHNGGSTLGSGSLLERGESALRNVDRVRAIEGVMAYNHLKEQLKPFFQQFADSGQAIGAEDIKAYFAKLRGDEDGIREAGERVKEGGGREEQSGY